MKFQEVKRARLATALKSHFEIWDITDEEILEATKGSFFRARVELGIALEDLGRSFRDLFRRKRQ